MHKSRSTIAILAMAALVASIPSSSFAKAKSNEESSAGKILLFIDLETVDGRAEKRFQPKPLPPMGESSLPYSDADISRLSSEAQGQAIEANRKIREQNYAAKRSILWENYEEQVKHQKAMIQRYQNTTVGRHLLVARDWFAGSMGEYAEFFEVIHRMDQDKANFESEIKGDGLEISAGEYIAILIFADPSMKTKEMQFPGAAVVTRTVCSLTVTLEVQTLDGRVVYSKNLEASETSSESNAAVSSGTDDLVAKTMRTAIDKAAEAIADHFTCELTVSVKGPKGDEDFDEDEVELTLDGESISADEGVRVAKGTHTLVAEIDGYEQKGGTKITVKKDMEKKIVFKKVAEESSSDE